MYEVHVFYKGTPFQQARSCCENLNKGNYLSKTTSSIFRILAEEQYFHYEKYTAVETESPFK